MRVQATAERPVVYGWLNKETGRLEYHDWETGAVLEGYYGTYAYFGFGDPAVMRTWKDSATGERGFAYVGRLQR